MMEAIPNTAQATKNLKLNSLGPRVKPNTTLLKQTNQQTNKNSNNMIPSDILL